MATFSKVKLSGSTDGKGIPVAATGSPGTTLHTAHASALDEIWLYVQNTGAAGVEITIEWGGTANPDDRIIATLNGKEGLVLVIPGLILTNGAVLKAFAATASVLVGHGFVNRIS